MNNDNNWNLLEKVSDDKPHIYDVNTDRELACPDHVKLNLKFAHEELDLAIRYLEDAAGMLIRHDAYIRNEVGGFDTELSEKMWRIAELYTVLFHGLSRRELKSDINEMYGCNADALSYNDHGYVDTDIAAEAEHEE